MGTSRASDFRGHPGPRVRLDTDSRSGLTDLYPCSKIQRSRTNPAGGPGILDDAEIVRDPDDDAEGNVQHIAENDLSVDEVEDVLLDPDNETLISRSSGRSITFG